MDNVTHTLVGLALARAGLANVSPRATLVLLLSANAPDIDIVAASGGALRYLEVHRGYTHSLVGLPVMAAACVLLAGLFRRRQRLRWPALFGLACIGVASHLILDWTNSYGIRLLLPFNSTWFAGDITSLTDGVLLIVLVLAGVWPWFAGLVSREIGDRPSRGQGLAIFALLFFVGYDVGRFILHERAVQELNSLLFAGAPPLRVAALPTAINPLRWTAIVETERAYRGLDVSALENVDPESGHVVYKINPDQATAAAKATEAFRFLQYFARFPAWSEEMVTANRGQLRRVDLTDLRFGAPNAGGFHSVAFVNERGAVEKSSFTFGSGQDIGPAR